MKKQENSYSLWLRPSQTQIDELTRIISGLSHRYRTTPFPPHITLLSNITAPINAVEKACRKIIERHQAFDIELKEIAYTKDYYRNLYILAKTETLLTSLYEDCKTTLSKVTDDTFMPHLSLLYGKLDAKKQQALQKELNGSYAKTCSCQRLDIFNTTKKTSEWHLVNSYYLSKSE
ncbi:MAG: hypothetical protein GKR92_13150 [Gammaproteobacteria bacterium]|nr:MAG: hypothetical protein GKR92_13150 [Gammaproteobacteria bacterium]